MLNQSKCLGRQATFRDGVDQQLLGSRDRERDSERSEKLARLLSQLHDVALSACAAVQEAQLQSDESRIVEFRADFESSIAASRVASARSSGSLAISIRAFTQSRWNRAVATELV